MDGLEKSSAYDVGPDTATQNMNECRHNPVQSFSAAQNGKRTASPTVRNACSEKTIEPMGASKKPRLHGFDLGRKDDKNASSASPFGGFPAISAKASSVKGFAQLHETASRENPFNTFWNNQRAQEQEAISLDALSGTVDEMDNEPESVICFGTISSSIVGVQHYSGVIGVGEFAILRRQPNNRYDRNAIACYNQRNQQVGHVPARNGFANLLAPVMDKHNSLIVEAKIKKVGSTFRTPMELKLYGPPEIEKDVVSFINRSQYLAGTKVTPAPKSPTKKAGSYTAGVSEQSLIKNKLEDLYKNDLDYESMPSVDPENVETELMDHQKRALWWMLEHESIRTCETEHKRQAAQNEKQGNVGFFKLITQNNKLYWSNIFTHSLTNYATPPRLPRGGILADDMGLGKTLEVLATIATSLGEQISSRPQNLRTLIICPLSVISNWRDQAAQHCPALSVTVYHGPSRSSEDWDNANCVLTTYGTLCAESKCSNSQLMSHSWHRLVFDEAHNIRNPNTKQTKAAFELKCTGPIWLCTGTPIQNQVKDIFPFVKLLKIQPLNEFVYFRTRILQRLKAKNEDGIINLRILLGNITLRRIKNLLVKDKNGSLKPLLKLPVKNVLLTIVQPSMETANLYHNLFKQSQDVAKGLIEKGKNYMTLLTLLSRLRSLCCDPRLLPFDLIDSLRNNEIVISPQGVLKQAKQALGTEKVEKMLAKLEEVKEDECVICLEIGGDVVTRCSHVYHRNCIEQHLNNSNSCPLCRQIIRKKELLTFVEEIEIDDTAHAHVIGVGPKILALMDFVQTMKSDDKLVIFSSFVQFLNLIDESLRDAGHKTLRIDGKCSMAQRQKAQSLFSSDPSQRIMLCSLKTAGTGINLVSANNLILMDPWWNPAAEEQAIDRIYRIGQKKNVTIIRMVLKDSIEEKMLKVAEDKRAIYAGAFERKSVSELRNVRWETMTKLFE